MLAAGEITEGEADQFRQALEDAFTFRVTWDGEDATRASPDWAEPQLRGTVRAARRSAEPAGQAPAQATATSSGASAPAGVPASRSTSR